MTDKPIAGRTRSRVASSQLQRRNSVTALLKELDENRDKMMARFCKISEEVEGMDEEVRLLRKDAMSCDCLRCPAGKCEIKAVQMMLERKFKGTRVKLRTLGMQLFHLNQTGNCILVEKLHVSHCKASDDCLLRMQKILKQDPLSLERKREVQDKITSKIIESQRHSALHDAVSRNHVKCVKFLLERGARVTSLSTLEGNTVLHTLYDSIQSKGRLEILKLLLKYGVSCMFQHHEAGENALKVAISNFELDQVSFLLQYGATMSEQGLEAALTETWKMYDLPVIQQFALHYSKRFNICPGGCSIPTLLIHHCYRQMVLADVPLHLCHEKLLEALQFYKVLGGKFHDGSNPNLMQYLKSYKHKRHFQGVKKRIKDLASNPLSLKEIARLAVRNCIIVDYAENIEKLEVPVDLEPFLRFEDIIITKIPDKYQEFEQFHTSSENDSDMEL